MQTKIMYTSIIALMLIASLSFVMAEDNSSDAIALYDDTSNLSDGIVISPAPQVIDDFNETSSWKTGWQQIKIALTFNQEKKAEMELKLAEMRLNQARHASKNNNTEAMQRAMDAHDRIIQRIQDRVQKVESKSNENSTKEKIGSLYALQQAVQVHEQRVAKLGAILENDNLSEKQKEVVEMRLQKAQNNTAHLQEVQAQKEDKLKTKLMAVANLTEEQAQAAIEVLKESKDKEQFRENVKDLREQVKEQAKEQKENRKEQRMDKPKPLPPQESNNSLDSENESD
jgi:hypothetical protein